MMETRQNLQRISEHVPSIANSKEEYLESITHLNQLNSKENNTISSNPNKIVQEINSRKDTFDKLKFQYIEQETKEKFLRSILDTPPLFVEQKDINELEESNKQLKQTLKEKKSENEKYQEDIEDLTKEVTKHQSMYELKYKETAKLLDEIDEMEKELSEMNETDFVNNDLTQIHELLQTTKVSPESITRSIHQESVKLDNKKREVDSMNTELLRNEEEIGSNNSQIIELNNKIRSLENQIHQQTSNQDKQSQQLTKIGKWYEELISVWFKLTTVENFKVNYLADSINIDITLGKKSIVLNMKDARIASYKIPWVHENLDSLRDSCNQYDDCIRLFVKSLMTNYQ